MLPTIKRVLFVAGALVLAAVLIPATAAAQNTFTVHNESHYQIYQLFVSPSNSNYWGSDRLGNRVLLLGYRFDLWVPYGWDYVKLVEKWTQLRGGGR
jgi:hypothetical protein